MRRAPTNSIETHAAIARGEHVPVLARIMADPEVRTMRDRLQEEVDHILEALPRGVTFASWYADGMTFDVFDFGDDIQREAVSYARGYLEGAADMIDETVLTVLETYNVRTTRARSRRKARR